jgi:L-histidine N-alpha-methyltransferase
MRFEPESAAASTADTSLARFASDVQYYLMLQPRQLPSRYLYDTLGSALFDAICQLPWYPITRAETCLLARHGRDIFEYLPDLSRIVELGSGNGEKLTTLIDSTRGPYAGRRLRASSPLEIHLIDVSAAALETSARTIGTLDSVRIVTHRATYEAGLDAIRTEPGPDGTTLAVFLGSNIGNFDPPGADAFLRVIRSALARGDALLLGADLVKPESRLLLAYDDPLGVTAAFNRNLLVRINAELGGNFDLDAFAHRALWNAEESRVEMRLVALRPQHVRVGAAALELDIEAGESIWTESSYKYRPDTVVGMVESAGFRLLEQWTDARLGFALTLVQAV